MFGDFLFFNTAYILLWRYAFVFFEGFYKIRYIVKPAFKGGFGYIFFAAYQHFAGALDAVKIKIIYRSFANKLLKKPTCNSTSVFIKRYYKNNIMFWFANQKTIYHNSRIYNRYFLDRYKSNPRYL